MKYIKLTVPLDFSNPNKNEKDIANEMIADIKRQHPDISDDTVCDIGKGYYVCFGSLYSELLPAIYLSRMHAECNAKLLKDEKWNVGFKGCVHNNCNRLDRTDHYQCEQCGEIFERPHIHEMEAIDISKFVYVLATLHRCWCGFQITTPTVKGE